MKKENKKIIGGIFLVVLMFSFVSAENMSILYGQNITPTGMIVAFNLSSCPSGWTEANGSGGTPDLRGIFIRGAGNNSNKFLDGSPVRATFGEFQNATSLLQNPKNDGAGYATSSIQNSESSVVENNPIITGFGTTEANGGRIDIRPYNVALTYCVKTTGSDYAEWIESSEEIWEGMIVSVDEENDNRVVRAKEEYDKNILGVVSTQPGWIIGEETITSVKLALVGQVPVRVVLENGEIKRGDSITSSSYIEGFGMKATEDKRIVGISLTELNEDSEGVYQCGEELCGAVKVILDLSWKNEGVMDKLSFLKKENDALKNTFCDMGRDEWC